MDSIEPRPTPLLVKAEVAASMLGLSKQRLYALVRSRCLPATLTVKFGVRQLRFNTERIREFVEHGGTGTEEAADE